MFVAQNGDMSTFNTERVRGFTLSGAIVMLTVVNITNKPLFENIHLIGPL